MVCKFCGEDLNLIRAHIIPEAFFRRLRHDGRAPKLLSEGQFSKRIPIGLYDENILCKKCDGEFGMLDDYAQRLLDESSLRGASLTRYGRVVGYEIPEFQYELLKLFFISLIWRASVSSLPFYHRIKLGPYETLAKEMLKNRQAGDPDDFGVVLAHFSHQFGGGLLDPHSDRFPPGINYNRFYLGGFVAYIKVDRRVAHGVFSRVQIKPSEPLRIVARDLERSKELPLMYKLVSHTLKAH